MKTFRYIAIILCTGLLTFIMQAQSSLDSCRYFGQLPPGDTACLFAPELFNNPEGYHSSPAFTKDLMGAYFSPMSRHGSLAYMDCQDQGNPEFIAFKGLIDAGDPFLAPDNNTLYFLSFQTLAEDPVRRERIWYAKRTKDHWGKAFAVSPCVYKHPTHWQFSVAANQNLYFTSEIGDKHEHGIYVSHLFHNDYREPVRLPTSINATNTENTPFIAPDESYLIFARKCPPDGKTDLFIAFRRENGSWESPTRLPGNINSRRHELCPLVSPDGRFLFFLSTRSGTSRIYWVRAFFLNIPGSEKD